MNLARRERSTFEGRRRKADAGNTDLSPKRRLP
jgi:hypothetical protein